MLRISNFIARIEKGIMLKRLRICHCHVKSVILSEQIGIIWNKWIEMNDKYEKAVCNLFPFETTIGIYCVLQ